MSGHCPLITMLLLTNIDQASLSHQYMRVLYECIVVLMMVDIVVSMMVVDIVVSMMMVDIIFRSRNPFNCDCINRFSECVLIVIILL